MNLRTLGYAGLLVLSSLSPLLGSRASSPGSQTPAYDGVTLKISAQPSRLTLHEPVVLILEIANDNHDPIHIDLGSDRKENLLIAITPPSGGKVQLPQFRSSGISRVGDVEIGAGDTYVQSIVLNEWYAFKDIGPYDIEVRFAKPVLASYEVAGGRGTFHTKVEIEPRNEQVLARRCEDLLASIENSTSYERWSESALALSYVKDPVPIPYLEKILVANKMIEPFAILGLERIATLEAVRALSSALEMTTNDVSTLARSALLRMESETTDPEVKEEIRRVVRESANSGN